MKYSGITTSDGTYRLKLQKYSQHDIYSVIMGPYYGAANSDRRL